MGLFGSFKKKPEKRHGWSIRICSELKNERQGRHSIY